MLVTANVVPSSPILVTLMMEAICSSETSVLTRTTRRNIPEPSILHTVWLNRCSLKFGRNLLLQGKEQAKQEASSVMVAATGFLMGAEDRSITFLRNTSKLSSF
jgi:hypothetical protein